MKTIYPSKNFLADTRQALNTHDFFEISIQGGWRGRILAKEVKKWLPVNDVELLKDGAWTGPSNWCGVLMMSLHATHYMALSANYKLQATVEGDQVVLTYVPL